MLTPEQQLARALSVGKTLTKPLRHSSIPPLLAQLSDKSFWKVPGSGASTLAEICAGVVVAAVTVLGNGALQDCQVA